MARPPLDVSPRSAPRSSSPVSMRPVTCPGGLCRVFATRITRAISSFWSATKGAMSDRASIIGATLGFAALVLVLRASTFFHSVENWDESLYLLMARSVLDGHPLYPEIWDHKPPGIFFLFAAAPLAFGRSVLSIRLLAWLAVTASCVLLFLVGRRLRSRTTGVVAGLLYAVFSLNDGGLASNGELFFTPFL